MSSFIPARTLVIRMSSIGDIVLTTPFLRSFKKRFPSAEIDFIIKKEFSELLRYDPNIDRLYEYDAKTGVYGLKELCRQLESAKYDMLVDLHNSLRSRLIRARISAGIKRTINKRITARFLLVNFKWNRYGGVTHAVDRYIESVSEFGVCNDGGGLEMHVPDLISEQVSGKFKDYKKSRPFLAGICPSAKHNTKRWLKEYFVILAKKIVSHYGASVVIFGGPEDRSYCEEVRRLIGTENAHNTAGELTLLQAAAGFDQCDIVIANDTGLMHMAAARKRPLLALFGPTVRELGFFPYGTKHAVMEHPDLSCRPCSHIGSVKCPKSHFRCMKEIDPASVFKAIRDMLDR